MTGMAVELVKPVTDGGQQNHAHAGNEQLTSTAAAQKRSSTKVTSRVRPSQSTLASDGEVEFGDEFGDDQSLALATPYLESISLADVFDGTGYHRELSLTENCYSAALSRFPSCWFRCGASFFPH